MKTLITILMTLVTLVSIQAQDIPVIKVGEEKLGITSLDIKVDVVGNIATTTYDMLFYNPKSTVLEGELSFPLGESQRVSRLALEVNGKLREAVVVEKEQGRVAFEAVVRRGVDPVLLEKGTGNNYKARIYPIPAKGYKRVVLAHEQELIFSEDAHYLQLPLGFSNTLDTFLLAIKIVDQDALPSLSKGSLENFSFAKMNSGYIAEFSKSNYAPKDALTIKIPQDYQTTKMITSKNHFYLYKTLNTKKRARSKAKAITLYWDASLSMSMRALQKELDLLNAYITHLDAVKINLVVFSNDVILSKKYNIKNGDWSALKSELKNTVYDGGTSYTGFFEDETTDEILLFSDGMKNLSDIQINTSKPIFVINSILKANHSELNTICNGNGGRYINLKNKSVTEALTDITKQSFKFLGATTSNTKTEVYPNNVMTVDSDFSITGKNFENDDTITLSFGYANEVTFTETIAMSSKAENSLVNRIWAQKKLDALQKDSKLNKNAIVAHSKHYNLVSDHTSLIVLESVWDYVNYNIAPPEELLEEYNAIIKKNNGKRVVMRNEEENEDSETSNFNGGNISGTVLDNDGLPLPGVNVVVKGTSNGAQTDFDGNYTIQANPGDVIVFSYVGFGSLETTIGNSSKVNISMQDEMSSLEEVVVTAQGIKREKKALGYAVSTVVAEDINNKSEGDMARVLSGKASGVQITSQSGTSGSANNVVIRGYSSITGNNQALIIVDGVPFSNDTNAQGSFINGNVGSSRLLDLDPNNIESINVLKGLAAATLYGSEGRNGVILVTTKAASTRNQPGVRRSNSTANTASQSNKFRGRLEVNENKLNIPYIIALRKAKSIEEAYQMYLKQRDDYKNQLAYFIDVHDFFMQKEASVYRKRILSNIAEIDYDNYELLRAFAYKLEEHGSTNLAAFIFKRILELRPEDSQSYRDLALAYEAIGSHEEAFELLKGIVTGEIYEGRNRRTFDGIKDIATHEISKLMANEKEIEAKSFTKTKTAEFDLRFVIDWNHNDTDIDLHVIDPRREECSYSNPKTRIGGRLSEDMTQGFGPEEYIIKNAVKGDYFIKVKYFGDRYQKIDNPTFMKVTMFKNYGKASEEKVIKVVRLHKTKDKTIVAKMVVM